MFRLREKFKKFVDTLEVLIDTFPLIIFNHIDFPPNQCYSYINQMVNIRVVIYIKITYANSKVEKYFSDYRRMQKALPAEWVRTIKKHIDRLRACECFGDFLKLGLGRPEQLTGYKNIRYSLHVTPNVRLIIEPDAMQETILICTTIEVEGVSDYHGSKDNWYIP